MDKINEATQKLLDKNNTGVVPKHIFWGRAASDYDRPSYLAVKNGKVWLEGSKAQCAKMIR